ncbi:hypothetical protein GOP47_0026386 [Adiantum capillus-veneris]|nr:hypothetical protein GOP47_0026386 [Adiantum capillus-veneris]
MNQRHGSIYVKMCLWACDGGADVGCANIPHVTCHSPFLLKIMKSDVRINRVHLSPVCIRHGYFSTLILHICACFKGHSQITFVIWLKQSGMPKHIR